LFKNDQKILVVSGGWSSERDISLRSGRKVYSTLKKKNFNVEFFDLNKNNLNEILDHKTDIIFNALHGEFGEDGGLACFAKNNSITITHSDEISSSICMDKKLTKTFISKKIDIEIPKTYNELKCNHFPLIAKPNRGGSSVGIKIINNNSELKIYLSENKKEIILEQLIEIDKELTVTVIENKGNIKALGVTEIKFNSLIYDYNAKYKKGYSDHIIPAEIPINDYKKLIKVSEEIFKFLGCKSIARIDFILKKNKNKYFFLEINTHPGLTDLSLAPEQAKYKGLSYLNLIKMILESAYAR
jgi:D-alanine-D-alanine ligase